MGCIYEMDVTIDNMNFGSLDIFPMCRQREIRIEFHELQIKIRG